MKREALRKREILRRAYKRTSAVKTRSNEDDGNDDGAIGDWFSSQTIAQPIQLTSTPLLLGQIVRNVLFKQIDTVTVSPCENGWVTVTFGIIFQFPLGADSLRYGMTQNGTVIFGSTGQTDSSPSFSGVATRSRTFEFFAMKGDKLTVFAMSTTGLDTTFIPIVNGATFGGGMSLSMSLSPQDCPDLGNCNPCHQTSSGDQSE